MSYLGTAWMNDELWSAIQMAEDDQQAFAIAATAVNETIRVGLGKLTAEVCALIRAQADTAAAMREMAEAVREVNVRPEDVRLEPKEGR